MLVPEAQRCSPARHAPLQTLPTHAKSQSLGFDHSPLVEQVSTSVGELHDKEPGRQAPPQLPDTQANSHSVTSDHAPATQL